MSTPAHRPCYPHFHFLLTTAMQHFKRLSLALTLTALMAGCSTGVKLDEAPVEDRSASSQMGSNAGSTSQSGVAGVNLGQSDRSTAGPMGVSRTVYFDFDSYVVKPEYQSTLDAHARFIKAVPGRTVVLEGHTDDLGGREYNLALGQRRAEAVRRSLALLGVADGSMEAISYGKEKPAVAGTNDDARSQNRRVEISYR